ncbi:MAG: FHA domain-containing protein, partial [Gammaproteobacteria bacterium]|nr:FHA domain-containing protein [Gammaproteobacteria bacterium]
QSIADLADYSGRPAAELEPLLVKLSDEDRRILRPVAPPLERKELKRYEIFHDVLAASVLAWTRDYRLEREKQALAAAHIKTLWRASGYVVLLAGFLVYWGYTKYIKVWKEGRPWAYVSSVSSGNNFQLTGYSSTMGRSVEGYLNTVDIRPQNVSRLHFMIYNTGVAVDLRSLNGTTVNGEFLPYGDTRTLNEGDVIALAGAAAYKFHWIEYGSIPLVSPPMLQEPPPQGWGLFIDGTSRRVTTLTGARYFVSKGDNGLTLDDQNSGDALAVLEWHDPGLSIQDMPDINALYFQAKENDYDYPFYTVPSGLSVGNLKTYQENHDLFEVVFSYDENNRFQIIPVDHNVERLQESE